METVFTGIAVVIDDEIGQDRAIDNLVSQINKRRMPCLTYDQLPETDVIHHFSGISFIILDWKLHNNNAVADTTEGVRLPEGASEANIRENIDFLKELIKSCFVPIFIFTNESKDDVISKLKEHSLYHENGCNRIFIKNKSELSGENNTARSRLFKTIDEWAIRNPSIYVLKTWEKEYHKAKNKLFNELFEISPYWPKILWKSFADDGSNKSLELGEMITRNIYTRMSPFEFSDEILKKRGPGIEKDAIRKVLEGERFIRSDHLQANDIGTGDIFKEEYVDNGSRKFRYYLNIRAQCDLLRSSSPDKIELYCLKGRVIDEKTINKKSGIPFMEGQFIEKVNHAIIGCIDDGIIIEFLFRDLKVKKWKDLKSTRIGRLLPPYITRIQQRYALYLQRQGLPRTPEVAVMGNGSSDSSGETDRP